MKGARDKVRKRQRGRGRKGAVTKGRGTKEKGRSNQGTMGAKYIGSKGQEGPERKGVWPKWNEGQRERGTKGPRNKWIVKVLRFKVSS